MIRCLVSWWNLKKHCCWNQKPGPKTSLERLPPEGFDSDAPDPEIIEGELRETVQGRI